MLERVYQAKLIKKIRKEYPNCMILKTDPGYIQGLPDLLILNENKWAALEVKRSKDAKHRPNQDYYVHKLNGMSFASFAYPENEREILNGIRQTFGAGRQPCLSESE